MEIKNIPIREINPAPYNPRVNLQPGDPRYDHLVRSIDKFGLVEPLVWNKQTGNLVGGHQRLKILVAQEHTSVDVVVVDLAPEQEKALNLALNKITGDWDEQKLAELLEELSQTPDFDFVVTGFELDEANDLINSVLGHDILPNDDFDVDAALEAAGPVVTQPGDLILLGRDPATQHRLLCGDCTDPQQVQKLMTGERAALFATDPPYLVSYDGNNRPNSNKKQSKQERITWDDMDANPDLYRKFIRAAIDEAIAKDAAWYCWYASRNHCLIQQAWDEAGALFHCQIIWAKNRGIPTRTWYLWQHEPCLMGWLKGNKPKRVSKKHLTTVWNIDSSGTSGGEKRPDHPTPKPVEVFEIPMQQHTVPGDICYEPFAGSGSQFIAAQRLQRRCFGLELNPKYCDVIVRRFIAMAGEDAVEPDVAERYRLTPSVENKVLS